MGKLKESDYDMVKCVHHSLFCDNRAPFRFVGDPLHEQRAFYLHALYPGACLWCYNVVY